MKWGLSAVLLALLATGCRTTPVPKELTPPPAPREFRAAWVATVGNIDWPSKPGLSTDQQKKEALAILDRASELKLNAIVLQVRTSCDAFYPSKIEPWSEYLTGQQGQAPNPYYDPLQFWIDESHKRGIELHAWLNPYRAKSKISHSTTAPSHVSIAHPELVHSFNGWDWLDPGEPAAAQQTLDVFKDLAHRYALDGVHMDDYFYPYPEYLTDPKTKVVSDFPDGPAYEHYQKTGGKLSREDWRRDNVNRMIDAINKVVHQERPDTQFGLSPFGLGKPSTRPPGVSGFSQYDKLYADVELWWNNGWCDYLTPQLYWKTTSEHQAFGTLVTYWKSQNKTGKHLWPGLYTSKYLERENRPTTHPTTWPVSELSDQIAIVRDQLPDAPGHVHFSMKALMSDDNGGLTAELEQNEYKLPALVPASTWLDHKLPPAPSVKVVGTGSSTRSVRISPNWTFFKRPWLWAIWTKENGGWIFHTQPAAQGELPISSDVTAVVVTSVDHVGNESPRVTIKIK